jgi:hypothetical protein
MSCMVPVNSTVASERAWEALLRRREEKMALTPIKLVSQLNPHKETCSTEHLIGGQIRRGGANGGGVPTTGSTLKP